MMMMMMMMKKKHEDSGEKLSNDVDESRNLLLLRDRRSIVLSSVGLYSTAAFTTTTTLLWRPQASHAGIDVSGLRVDTGGGGGGGAGPAVGVVVGNPDLAAQLRQYDGSAASRISEIKAAAAASSASPSRSTTSTAATSTATTNPYAVTYAYRSSPGYNPSLTKLGLGERYRLEDRVQGPTTTALDEGSTMARMRSSSSSSSSDLRVSFEFPSDWLQLDRAMGGLQYVDQRNGDKLYLLQVQLPPNTTLTSVDKRFFGDAIFDPQGSLVKSAGITIDSYHVGKSETFSDGSISTAHRRVLLKYATVTGNGLVTERRGWADAYQVDSGGTNNDKKFAYMLVTSSNAVKFDAQGRERATVDAIVNSFQLETV
jgi:hypothetical protein